LRLDRSRDRLQQHRAVQVGRLSADDRRRLRLHGMRLRMPRL
jgi:hypothetical protein